MDGGWVSVLVPLEKNARRELDVRISEGARLYDGEHVWEVRPVEADGVWNVDVADLTGSARAPLPLRASAQPVFRAMEKGRLWFETPTGPQRCTMSPAACTPDAALPELAFTHAGPGAGFRVSRESDGTVRVRVPIDSDADPGNVVAMDVARVLAVRWVRRSALPDSSQLNRWFRGRGNLSAPDLEVRVDGALDEWTGGAPLVVDARWQIDAGADGWSGPRDASFSIAAANGATGVCLAGRVRDDEIVAGDALRVVVDGAEVRIPLDGPAPAGTATTRAWHGRYFETCLSGGGLRVGEHRGFTANFVDVDPGESTTELSAAPRIAGRPTGTLRRG